MLNEEKPKPKPHSMTKLPWILEQVKPISGDRSQADAWEWRPGRTLETTGWVRFVS